MPEEEWKKIGDILVELSYINKEQLKEALNEQKVTSEKIGVILLRKGWVTNDEFNHALGVQTGYTVFDLSKHIISPELIKMIPHGDAFKYKIIPVTQEGDILTVAMMDPTNLFIIDEVQRITGQRVEAVFASEMSIQKAQDQYYGRREIQEVIASIDKEKLKDIEKIGEAVPIIKLVDLIIVDAVKEGASDIHIEPEDKIVSVRFRVDGMLHRTIILPKELQPAIISRFKIMADLDIAEKRVPQDGRLFMRVGSKDIDFRISTCPTVYGENIVLRILDKSALTVGLEKLGFPQKELEIFENMIHQPYGIILVTGPTGSGKSTTLYAAIQKINREDINIMTIEDPVEFQFHQIRQVQVSPKAGLVFASALRSFLRQDPDVIMVGEIRDLETAICAVQAALTGHLLLSTLHTNDSPTAFPRLMDMGIEPFMVANALLGVLAQRLIRKLCLACKEEYSPSPELIKSLGLKDKDYSSLKLFKEKGCEMCKNTGFQGRIGIYELLKVTPEMQELIIKKASADSFRALACKQGMTTLREAAIAKLLEGATTIQEVLRVTQSSA